jgi:hypothetical protein
MRYRLDIFYHDVLSSNDHASNPSTHVFLTLRNAPSELLPAGTE